MATLEVADPVEVEEAVPAAEEAAPAAEQAAPAPRRPARSNAWVAPTGHHNTWYQ